MYWCYAQVPQAVTNMILSYDVKDFMPPAPALRFRDLRDLSLI